MNASEIFEMVIAGITNLSYMTGKGVFNFISRED